MADERRATTRRRMLQWSAAAATGLAGCMGNTDDETGPGVTIVETQTPTEGTPASSPSVTGTATADGDPTTTREPETATTEETESSPTEAEPTSTEEGDTEPTETDTDTDTEAPAARQLRIIAAEGAEAFEYTFTIDGDAELVTTGEYNAVPKEQTADGRGEEIVDNDDGTVTISGVVADGGGDTFRIWGEVTASAIDGPAEVYLDGELVDETGHSPGTSACFTIDEPGEYALTADLSGSTDVCVDIRASDVVLDGDGHSISGSDRQGTGISVAGANVLIRNVTVRGFDVGLELDGTRVRHCVATENTTGVRVSSPSSRGSVFGSEITDNDADGIVVEAAEGQRFLIQNNRIVENGRYGVLATASDVDVYENEIADNDGWGVWAEDGEVFLDSNEVRSNDGGTHVVGTAIIDNEIVTDNRGPGVSIGGDAELWASTIANNDGDGLSLGRVPATDGSAVLERCFITDNGGDGIAAEVDLAVRESAIEGSGELGVRYEGPDVAEARNNFWGASDGPSSPDDAEGPLKDPEQDEYADGSGDAVSEGETLGVSNVRFAPWRSTPP